MFLHVGVPVDKGKTFEPSTNITCGCAGVVKRDRLKAFGG